MLFGIKFIKAYNSLIVCGAEFWARQPDKSDKRYKWDSGPHGEQLKQRNQDGEWEKAPVCLVDILPQDFGMNWTERDFIIALSFWSEGYRLGQERAR